MPPRPSHEARLVYTACDWSNKSFKCKIFDCNFVINVRTNIILIYYFSVSYYVFAVRRKNREVTASLLPPRSFWNCVWDASLTPIMSIYVVVSQWHVRKHDKFTSTFFLDRISCTPKTHYNIVLHRIGKLLLTDRL